MAAKEQSALHAAASSATAAVALMVEATVARRATAVDRVTTTATVEAARPTCVKAAAVCKTASLSLPAAVVRAATLSTAARVAAERAAVKEVVAAAVKADQAFVSVTAEAAARRARAEKAAVVDLITDLGMASTVSTVSSVKVGPEAVASTTALAAAVVAVATTVAVAAAPECNALAPLAQAAVVAADRHTLNPERLTPKIKRERRRPVTAKS